MRLHLHRWRIAKGFEGAVHAHLECRCGTRRIKRIRMRGYSPVDSHWLETGVRFDPVPPPRPTDSARSARPLR